MQALKTLDYLVENRIATLRLNRPDAANGLNVELAAELAYAARYIAADNTIKAVVLTGEGKFFCAGGDIKAMLEFGDDVRAGLKGIADDLHRAISSFARMRAPLIVAVNGTAAGAGLSLAASGDLVVADDSAKFTMAYSKVGLSADGSSSFYLPRLIGLRKTQELMYTNRVLSATEAVEWGLINKAVPTEQLMSAASDWAEQLAAGALDSNATMKSLLLATYENGLEQQMELEGVGISLNSELPDGREGVAAFVDKRAPKFA